MKLEEIKKQYPEYNGQIRKNYSNLKGQKFGKLTVLYRTNNRKNRTCWVCQCDCGNISLVYTYNLSDGHTKSCGNCKGNGQQLYNYRYTKKTYNDLTGKQFRDLKVLYKKSHFVLDNRILWRCQCICGKQIDVDSHTLQSGRKINCGCK